MSHAATQVSRVGGAKGASLVGAAPIENVLLMEDHDGAYHAWKRAGVNGRILLHIDAHLDWAWIKGKDPLEILEARTLAQVESLLQERYLWNLSGRRSEELIDIGNYVYPALQEGIVREFYCILPDAFFENPRIYRDVVTMFERFRQENPRGLKNIRQEHDRIVVEISGRQVTACCLSNMPRIEEAVLLDIDTDFLTTHSMGPDLLRGDPWKQLPWIWPEELVGRLLGLGVRTDFVTIAYSVEGGFTPLSYKYLGDELALRLKETTLPNRERALMAHKRDGAFYRSRDELDRAIREYEQAMDLASEDASIHFNLAYLWDKKGKHDQAAARYRQAVQLDPTYGTAYNNFGSPYLALGMLDCAREEYLRILRWDPRHTDAHYGLAQTLVEKEQWADAIGHYQRVLELRPDHAKAHRDLGGVYAELGMREAAILQLKQSIDVQPHDGWAFWRLGELCSRQKHWDEAIDAYRGALRCGFRAVAIYIKLGGLYLRKGRFYKAWRQYRQALPVLGGFVVCSIGRQFRTLFNTLLRGINRAQLRHPPL